MSADRSDYDAHWRRSPHHSRGPVEWRARHHGYPHPATTQLTELADEHHLTLELDVCDEQLGEPGKEYRHLGLLTVRTHDGKILAAADAGLLTLQMAASTCSTRLKAAL